MSEVKRYNVIADKYGDGTVEESESGSVVFYEDYAALKERFDFKQNLTEQIVELKAQRDALAESFDELAKAVGWSVEQCEQTGESPMDVAVSLVNLVAELEKDAYPTTDEWAIDKTCGRPILVYKGCSVIEAEDAAYILNLVKQDRAAIRDAGHEVYD